MLSRTIFILLFVFIVQTGLFGQAKQPENPIIKDPSLLMKIPAIRAMDASAAHLYVLSEKDGLIVFRTNTDSLSWLYSSQGMEKRGDRLEADIRFAYLYGSSKRLTVIEPTSMLGVFSSTRLPIPARDLARIDKSLYLALDTLGLGMLSLQSPSSVDSALTYIAPAQMKNSTIIQVETSGKQLFALSNTADLFLFNKTENTLKLDRSIRLKENIETLFVRNNQLTGSTADGQIFSISSNGAVDPILEVQQPVEDIYFWNNKWVVRTTAGEIWVKPMNGKTIQWAKDRKAGNMLALSAPELFMAEYDKLYRLIPPEMYSAGDTLDATAAEIPPLKLQKIDNVILPYPNPLLLALELVNEIPPAHVQFSLRTNIENINIRGSGLYWQPSHSDIGRHTVTLIATTTDNQIDSTSFVVDIRSFNTPPRISPIRSMKIGADEPFTLPIRAFDPDATDKNLLRYMGVDLPSGASIDEQTGEFTWNPTLKQVGKHTLQVVVTDQYGAAASKEFDITVIENKRQ